MADLLWALFCERAIVNSKTNNISLIEIVEQLSVPDLPIVIPQPFFIVTLWEKKDKDKEETFYFRIISTHLEQDEVNIRPSPEIECVIPHDKERLRNLCQLSGIRIEKEKPLYFIIQRKVDDNWDEVQKITVQIKKK
jgi:hypothetical protein